MKLKDIEMFFQHYFNQLYLVGAVINPQRLYMYVKKKKKTHLHKLSLENDPVFVKIKLALRFDEDETSANVQTEQHCSAPLQIDFSYLSISKLTMPFRQIVPDMEVSFQRQAFRYSSCILLS